MIKADSKTWQRYSDLAHRAGFLVSVEIVITGQGEHL